MTDSGDGGRILASLNQVRAFHQQVGALIEAADELMDRGQWQPRTNQCASVGTVPSRSDSWMPQDVFHFYEKKSGGASGVIPFVSVALFDREDRTDFTEPLLTAGILKCMPGAEASTTDLLGYSHIHVWMPGRTDDGAARTVAQATEWPGWKQPIETITTLGVPLTSVRRIDELRETLIAPLLELLKKLDR